VCSDHFTEYDIKLFGKRRYLDPNAVPVRNLPLLQNQEVCSAEEQIFNLPKCDIDEGELSLLALEPVKKKIRFLIDKVSEETRQGTSSSLMHDEPLPSW